MKRLAQLATATVLAAALLSAGATAATKLTTKFKDWEVYQHSGSPADICFATSKPKETAPRGISRDSAYFYVSAWPKDGVKAEISLKLGYEIEQGSDVVVQIGNGRFRLFPKGDKAFVRDPRDELKLIEAMKGGSFMVVTAKSESGTSTKDTYSLIGVTKAIGAIDSCS
ncbi:MAG: invasion associated locus B family protein [Pseudomonadota bacterium]